MHIHILGICGTFMGGLAALARESGHTVTGCDAGVYPPMSEQLRALGIDLIEGYDRAQLDIRPDVFVIGNVVSRARLPDGTPKFPLMEAILDAGAPYISGPQWLAENVLHGRHVLAVAGTHGKTSTASMLAWILECAGLKPGFLIGGVPLNFGISARLGEQPERKPRPFFVIEADEYDTAFFDKRSKFVHYRPRTLVLNNLEFDHADIFDNLAAIERQFQHLLRTVPACGQVIVNAREPALARVLERHNPDEVIAAVDLEDYSFTPKIISECETAGVRLAIIPFYADYMPAHPQFDDLNGIPLLNIRRIPLDNFANAFIKRLVDIIGSAVLLVVCSPAFLFCTIGVLLSSPGPVLFRQQRVGRYKKPFNMLKFRSMRVNDTQDSAWSTQQDSRRTRFGSFIRKCSLDELPQFWNVLKGEMSLVGPRPEIPHFVDQFKDEIPLYMVRHQVRPGITGWAQVNGLRGDTPIKERVEYDIFYIENWDFWFDIRILLATVFKGKFINEEQIAKDILPASDAR